MSEAKVTKHPLLLEIGQVWIAAMLANIFLYLFQIAAGRGLGPEDYGLFGSLIGVIYLYAASSNAIQMSVARVVAEGRTSSGGGGDFDSIVSAALLQMLALGSLAFVLISLASPAVAGFLHTDNYLIVISLGVLMAVALLTPVIQGALLGAERYAWYSAGLVLSSAGRLLLGLIVLGLGLGITGLLWAVCLAVLLTAVLGLRPLKLRLSLSRRVLRDTTFSKSLIPGLLGFLALSVPTAADVILVRHFFPAAEAGLYAGVATLGRIVVFLPIAVSLALFPKMARDAAQGGSATGSLYLGFVLTLLLSGSAALLFSVFPHAALGALLGAEYAAADHLLPLYATAMLMFSLSAVFLYYNLAVSRNAYLYVVLLPHILLELLLPWMIHGSVTQVIWILVAVNGSLLASSIAFQALSSPGLGRWLSRFRASRSHHAGEHDLDKIDLVPEEAFPHFRN